MSPQRTPRRTFDEGKLQELAASIKHHGLIQPVTVRPNSEGFELIAGARRYRAAQLAELFSIPARIVELTDAQSQEWRLVELSIVGKSVLCLSATSARRLYVIDVPGLPQNAGYNGNSAAPCNGMRSLILRYTGNPPPDSIEVRHK